MADEATHVAMKAEQVPEALVIIPAHNEAERIELTVTAVVSALLTSGWADHRVLVVDDGSTDDTAGIARAAGAEVLRLDSGRGKGGALMAGLARVEGRYLLFLDADLGDSASEGRRLLEPLRAGEADLTIARLPSMAGSGGFGLVMRLARWATRRLGGRELEAPLCGQRGMTWEAWEKIGRLDAGFGVEVGMNIDALRAGLRIVEVPLEMTHRHTGRDWPGFRHRGRQFWHVLRAVARRLLR